MILIEFVKENLLFTLLFILYLIIFTISHYAVFKPEKPTTYTEDEYKKTLRDEYLRENDIIE